MLVKVQVDDVLGQDYLAYDLLDATGNVLFKAGESVKTQVLKKSSKLGLFRVQADLPIEWVIQDEMPHMNPETLQHILTEMPTSQSDEKQPQRLIVNSDATPYLKAMFGFWQKLESGEEADIALLEIMGEHLIAEIIHNMGQLQYLNQLRIRDEVTYSHTLDVTTLSIALGVKLGLNKKDLEVLALGALLHDVGKLFIPKPIMFKAGRLSDSEFEVMQAHPELGYRVLREEFKLPDEVARPALEHQELYAGGGYPQNLSGDGIHYFSQIVKIADVYDALTSVRPYKEALPSQQAIKIMLFEGGKSFNPSMLRDFIELANYPGEIPEDLG